MIKRFFSYVEIRTKIASLLPFLLGLVYTAYAYGTFSWSRSLLFFVSMTFFDMATTALNNYLDTQASHTGLPFTRARAKWILAVLLGLAALTGLYLAWLTGPVVLAAGAACFFVGIVYTFGPAPISRMPLGEIFSGLFMGLFIPFITVYINAPAKSLVDYAYAAPILDLSFNIPGLIRLLLLSLPLICGIANIMLANNTCDIEHDTAINRFTLPYYLGRRKALNLFAALYYLAFAAIPAAVLFGVLPILSLLTLPVLIPVQININRFRRKPNKAETFPLSVQNFVLLSLPLIATTALAIVIWPR